MVELRGRRGQCRILVRSSRPTTRVTSRIRWSTIWNRSLRSTEDSSLTVQYLSRVMDLPCPCIDHNAITRKYRTISKLGGPFHLLPISKADPPTSGCQWNSIEEE